MIEVGDVVITKTGKVAVVTWHRDITPHAWVKTIGQKKDREVFSKSLTILHKHDTPEAKDVISGMVNVCKN